MRNDPPTIPPPSNTARSDEARERVGGSDWAQQIAAYVSSKANASSKTRNYTALKGGAAGQPDYERTADPNAPQVIKQAEREAFVAGGGALWGHYGAMRVIFVDALAP